MQKIAADFFKKIKRLQKVNSIVQTELVKNAYTCNMHLSLCASQSVEIGKASRDTSVLKVEN